MPVFQCNIESYRTQSIVYQDESKRNTENRLYDILLGARANSPNMWTVGVHLTFLQQTEEEKKERRCHNRIPYKCIYTVYK